MACVDSALQQRGDGYEIIVVDNGSGDGSYERLKKHFRKVPHVTVKSLKQNLGFARGNNAGIRYARARFGAENCFICNSDVVFGPALFEELLAAAGKGIGVISPTVFDADYRPQPPSVCTNHPYGTIVFAWLYVLYRSLPRCVLKKIHHFRQEMKLLRQYLRPGPENRTAAGHTTKPSGNNPEYSFTLQGCAFLLTGEFFRFYRQLYPKTFLYGEELNLSVYLKKAGLRAIVAETSPVLHKGKQSSKELYREDGEKRRLRLARQSLLHSVPLLFLRYKILRKLF